MTVIKSFPVMINLMADRESICSRWKEERSKHPSFGEGKGHEDVQRMWDDAASTYNDSQYSEISDKIVTTLLNKGIIDKDSTILDIGCGTGSFALRFSPYVSKIIGTDSSPKMLEKMMGIASKMDIHNIEPVLSDCLSIPSDIVCDVAFSSLCPPMNDPDALTSMESHSTGYCVYVSSANIGHGIEGEIWKELGCDYSYSGYDTTYPYEYLRSIGKDVSLEFFTRHNHTVIKKDECVDRYFRLVGKYRRITEHEIDVIGSIIDSHTVDGSVDLSRDMRMGMIVWTP